MEYTCAHSFAPFRFVSCFTAAHLCCCRCITTTRAYITSNRIYSCVRNPLSFDFVIIFLFSIYLPHYSLVWCSLPHPSTTRFPYSLLQMQGEPHLAHLAAVIVAPFGFHVFVCLLVCVCLVVVRRSSTPHRIVHLAVWSSFLAGESCGHKK